jgi:hypothetical protein
MPKNNMYGEPYVYSGVFLNSKFKRHAKTTVEGNMIEPKGVFTPPLEPTPAFNILAKKLEDITAHIECTFYQILDDRITAHLKDLFLWAKENLVQQCPIPRREDKFFQVTEAHKPTVKKNSFTQTVTEQKVIVKIKQEVKETEPVIKQEIIQEIKPESKHILEIKLEAKQERKQETKKETKRKMKQQVKQEMKRTKKITTMKKPTSAADVEVPWDKLTDLERHERSEKITNDILETIRVRFKKLNAGK